MFNKSIGASDIVWGTLGGIPISPHIFKYDFLLFLTVLKKKCFIDLYPELKFVCHNVK
jgi:hypothetical protein